MQDFVVKSETIVCVFRYLTLRYSASLTLAHVTRGAAGFYIFVL